MNLVQSLNKTYNKLSVWGKILIFVVIVLVVVTVLKPLKDRRRREGFESDDRFLFKSGYDVYDDFYSTVYDMLVYSNLKDAYEVGEIVNRTQPSQESKILDIGCGTGHHVSELAQKNYDVVGIDVSPSMIKQAKEAYPKYTFKVADALRGNTFNPNSFTHILCLYFTIYYMSDKMLFLRNCINWLRPGGYLVVHLVDRDMFDPILPPGNPLIMVSPQRYAKDRITRTSITFTDFKYDANFDLDEKTDKALFTEKFKFNDSGKARKNEHQMYMPPMEKILEMAQEIGFLVQGRVDLVRVTYEYQYLYILVKPG
jgi:SAM-dependent methyltransferase